MQKRTVLIVGAGIAGTTLAHRFQSDFQVTLVDDQQKNNSTRVAAGMINPMNFKRMVPCWNAGLFLDYAIPYYKQLENEWNSSFLFPVRLAKLMNNENEVKLWKSACNKEDTKDLISSELEEEKYKAHFNFKEKVGIVTCAYQLNTVAFLDAARKNLNIDWIEEGFKHEDIRFDYDQLRWKKKTFDYIIFCEGMGVIHNPFFKHLPFRPTKGELIKVACEQNFKETIKKNIFFHPEGNGEYWVGATYNHQDMSWEPSSKGKKQLIDKLNDIVKFPYEITQHKAGVRPTVKDRRPYLGKHHEHPELVIFNGLGTRGVLMAPLLVDQLFHHLTKNRALDPEVDINRV